MTDRYKESIQGARDCIERNKDGGVYLPDLLVVIDSQQAEIERLENGNLKEAMIFNSKTIARAKTEAVKEFAEEVKKEAAYCSDSTDELIIFQSEFDNLVKKICSRH